MARWTSDLGAMTSRTTRPQALARTLANSGVGSETAIVIAALVHDDRHRQVGSGDALGQHLGGLGRGRLLREVDHGNEQLRGQRLGEVPLADGAQLHQGRPDPLPRVRLLDERLGQLVVADQLGRDEELSQLAPGCRGGAGSAGSVRAGGALGRRRRAAALGLFAQPHAHSHHGVPRFSAEEPKVPSGAAGNAALPTPRRHSIRGPNPPDQGV